MNMNLSPDDQEKLRQLRERRQRNNDVSWMLFDYLNHHPCMITQELMEQINGEGTLPVQMGIEIRKIRTLRSLYIQ